MGKKISQLDAITTAGIDEATDLVAVFDTTANKLKKISVEDFLALVPGFDISSLADIAAGDIVQANDDIAVYDATAGVAKKISVEDFLSLVPSGALTHWAEGTGTNSSGSDTYSLFEPDGVGASIDAVITPKGDGSFRLREGGSDRGIYSVDLQINSSGIDDKAGGNYSCITHGNRNTVASGADYSRAGGRYASARRYGEDVWASASATPGPGTDQMAKMVLIASVTGISATELSSDASTTKRIELSGTDSLLRVVVDLVATCTAPGNGTTVLTEVYSTSKAVVIHISSGVSTIIGTTTYGTAITETSMADCDLTFDIDAGTQDLKVLFTPPSTAGTTTVIRVTASAHITEMQGN